MCTDTEGAKRLIIERWDKNFFIFQKHLLFALNVNNYRCKIVENNKSSDTVHYS